MVRWARYGAGRFIKKKSASLRSSTGISPRTIQCALVTIRLSIAWRNTSVSWTVGSRLDWIRSCNTFPAPTGGSWSLSPTMIRRQPSGRASSRLEKRLISTMESSSTITASASSGLRASRAKTGRSFSVHSTSSRRWIVFASLPVSSDMRFAARPVGAARATSSPSRSKSVKMPLSVVVLPVPGPPVRMSSPFWMAVMMARRCFSSY